MQLIKVLKLLEYIDFLIRTKATGSPREFAAKLNISERQLYRILEEYREIGFPIKYSKERESYFYECQTSIKIELLVGEIKILKI